MHPRCANRIEVLGRDAANGNDGEGGALHRISKRIESPWRQSGIFRGGSKYGTEANVVGVCGCPLNLFEGVGAQSQQLPGRQGFACMSRIAIRLAHVRTRDARLSRQLHMVIEDVQALMRARLGEERAHHIGYCVRRGMLGPELDGSTAPFKKVDALGKKTSPGIIGNPVKTWRELGEGSTIHAASRNLCTIGPESKSKIY